MARFGINVNMALGISMPKLRGLAKADRQESQTCVAVVGEQISTKRVSLLR